MKVRIEMTLEVDQEAWATHYCLVRQEVREDVKLYAESQVKDSFAAQIGLITRVIS